MTISLSTNRNLLLKVIEIAQEINQELLFEFSKDSLKIYAYPKSHTIFLSISIPRKTLLTYSPNNSIKKLMLDSSKLLEFLKVYGDEDIKLEFQKNMIVVGHKKEFKFYIFGEEEIFDIPKYKKIDSFSMTKSLFDDMLKQLKVFSNFFTLQINNNEVVFIGEDEIVGSGSIRIPSTKILSTFSQVYPIEFLLKIVTHINCNDIIVSICEENNLEIEMEFDNIKISVLSACLIQ